MDRVHSFLPQNILLVQRQMSVKESDVEQFQQDLKIYTEATCSQLDNLQYVFPCHSLSDLQVFHPLAWLMMRDSPSLSVIPPTSHHHHPPTPVSFHLYYLFHSVSVQNLPDRSCFIMYEFWQDRLSWMR